MNDFDDSRAVRLAMHNRYKNVIKLSFLEWLVHFIFYPPQKKERKLRK